MSFKLNDYDAFLTSLFDKNNQQQKVKLEDTDKMQESSQFEQIEQATQQLHSQSMSAQHPQSAAYTTEAQQQGQPTREEQIIMMRQHSLPSQHQVHMNDDGAPFPVDFDFGLVAPSFSYTTNTNRSKSLSFSMGNHGGPNSQEQRHPLHPQNNHNPGNISEFMAEMGAENNGNEPGSGEDTYNPSLNGLEHPRTNTNNLFSMQHVNTQPSSYNSDFGPIDEQSSSMIVGRDSLSPISANNGRMSPGMDTDPASAPSNILGVPTSHQLMREATSISFQSIDHDSDRISPKMRESFPSAVEPITSATSTTTTNTSTSLTTGQANTGKKTRKQRKAKSISGPVSGHLSGGEDSSSGLSPNMQYRHSGRPRVKSAHNVIEQRYRNKINDKFTALQNSVPTLRVLAQRKERERLQMKRDHGRYDSSDDEPIDESLINDESIDLEGLEPARKLNKATILANSIEYIKFLELKNDRMRAEREELLNKALMMGIVIDDDLDNESND
ncbi:Sterol regulatory element-binding protein 1 [Spathaspora sp. JA1]|nr:Sterol regulatory element-binding protein 1 [Spathaspora sp. JA1]